MFTHVIVKGDILWALAQRYRISLESLLNANPGVVPEKLQKGQVLHIPNGGTNSVPSNNARMNTTLNGEVPAWCERLRHFINIAAGKANVPADLIAAVIYQESDGNINVNSTANPNGGSDSGVMQVNQHTANELRKKYPDRFIGISGLAKDIMLGSSYLRDMYDTVGEGYSWPIALRAYNSGPYGVDKNDLRALPKGTGDRTYVDKVLRIWRDISTGNNPPADHYQSIFG